MNLHRSPESRQIQVTGQLLRIELEAVQNKSVGRVQSEGSPKFRSGSEEITGLAGGGGGGAGSRYGVNYFWYKNWPKNVKCLWLNYLIRINHSTEN